MLLLLPPQPPATPAARAVVHSLPAAAHRAGGVASDGCPRKRGRTLAPGLASLVAAERAFARLSVDSGAQTAFLANLADSAILFRPGPVPGRAFQRRHPIPAAAGTLAWTPHWAGVSRAGDLGFTSGPWIATLAGRVVAHGTYNSVWRRTGGGPWQVLLDVGVADSTTATAAAAAAGVAACGPVVAARTPRMSRGAAAAMGDDVLAAVLRADTLLGRGAADPTTGFEAVAAPDARFVREHRPPGGAASAVENGAPQGAPLGGGVAASGDLAYTYGTYTRPADRPAGPAERGHYLRVWRVGPRGWTLVLDVTNALPPSAAPVAAPVRPAGGPPAGSGHGAGR